MKIDIKMKKAKLLVEDVNINFSSIIYIILIYF